MALLPRQRQAERAGGEGVAEDILHGFDFVGTGLALLALIAHDVVTNRRVANQRAGVYADALVKLSHVLRDGFPVQSVVSSTSIGVALTEGREPGGGLLPTRP